jgi:tRNA 2-thiouridine synthesizing protein A
MEGITISKEIDARGSFCPGPLMELIRTVKVAEIGDVIAVISSDEGSKKDIPAWVAKAHHEFIGTEPAEGGTRFVVRKAR